MRNLFTIFIFLFFFIHSSLLNAQGEALENGYLKTFETFSTVPLDTLWDYFPAGKVPFDSLNVNTAWTKVNPLTFQDADKKPLTRTGVSWFQQKFKVVDALNGKPMAFFVGHFGASEIYLDGKLIARYGDIWATSGKDKSYMTRHPIFEVLTNTPVHTLSIRYAPNDFDKITSPQLLRGFIASISTPSEVFLPINIDALHLVVSSTIYIVFALFFFCIFIFYPKRLASLMTVFALLDFAILFSSGGFSTFTTNPSQFFLANLFWKSAVATASLFYLLFVYTLYYQKFIRLSWLLLAFIVLKILFIFSDFHLLNNYLFIIGLLLTVETFRVLLLGIKHNRVGFWILFIGEVFGMIFFAVFIADIFRLNDTPSYYFIKEIGGFLSDLSAPFSLALQLAWEFGSSNRNLQKQLNVVQKLSKENLEKEQEKQHILSTQNETLEQQVTERTSELANKNQDLETEKRRAENALTILKATQDQLIQSEKLASLGELTAGIAHEIQNPLNFVNNFAELNVDLAKDIKIEMHKPEIDKPYVEELLTDLTNNQKNINLHGKRAASIVTSMLEHSRLSTGVKEMTDINKLADEYFRLSFHGLRAKDKDFNADMISHFDTKIPKIEIVPQDVGRVILNLINNAFYAVNEKNKSNATQLSESLYTPTVTVSTKKLENAIEIRVKDNGTGMSETVRAKVFQPFFTTKPPGQGTGLGLSLAYDIVTKGHGGTLDVVSTEGVGSEFIIQIPI